MIGVCGTCVTYELGRESVARPIVGEGDRLFAYSISTSLPCRMPACIRTNFRGLEHSAGRLIGQTDARYLREVSHFNFYRRGLKNNTEIFIGATDSRYLRDVSYFISRLWAYLVPYYIFDFF